MRPRATSHTVIVQKQRSRTYNGTTYFKYRITIPVQIAEQLKLEGGENIEISIVKNTLIIRKIANG